MNRELVPPSANQSANNFRQYLSQRRSLLVQLRTLASAKTLFEAMLFTPNELSSGDKRIFEGRTFEDVSMQAQAIFNLGEQKLDEFDELNAGASKLFVGSKILLRKTRQADCLINNHARVVEVPDVIGGEIISINGLHQLGDFTISAVLRTDERKRNSFLYREPYIHIEDVVHVVYSAPDTQVPLVAIDHMS